MRHLGELSAGHWRSVVALVVEIVECAGVLPETVDYNLARTLQLIHADARERIGPVCPSCGSSAGTRSAGEAAEFEVCGDCCMGGPR